MSNPPVPETSVLVMENIEHETYEWSIKVPPKSKVIQTFELFPKTLSYSFNKTFKTGLLSKVDHTLYFRILQELKLFILVHINDSLTTIGHRVNSIELQTLCIGQIQHRCIVSLTHSGNRWMNDSFVVPPNVWLDSTDTLNLILKIQRHIDGLCISSPLEIQLQSPVSKELDTMKYFLSEFLSDITLVANNRESFPAHRFILACRSQVFERMFQQNMMETIQGRVPIEDIEPTVLKELLRYIYTGEFKANKANTDDGDISLDLFKSAHKYDIQDLKVKCVNRIATSITFQNAVEVYVLAETYDEQFLKTKAVNVMKKDKAKLFKDVETLQEFTQKFPNLALELMTI